MISYFFTYLLTKFLGSNKTVNEVLHSYNVAKIRAVNDLSAVQEQRTLQAAALTDLISDLAEQRNQAKLEAERAGELSAELLSL